MKPIRLLTAIALLVAFTCSAFAADPVFPPGVRVGLTPLVGLAPAKTFTGFETSDQGVKVLMAELPAAAYGEVETAFKAGSPGGITRVNTPVSRSSGGISMPRPCIGES